MSEFQRKLNQIDRLQALASAEGENWWKELLRLWQPPGTDAGANGLRLAIRSNYLNFYRRGQSVAKVAFDQNGSPYLSVHLEYLGIKADGYARLKNGFFTSRSHGTIPFHAGKTLPTIIEKTKEWGGAEKYFVDQTVAHNESVVDLEIALPRIDDVGGAPRMDLALLERGSNENQVKLVFWEAKTIDDSRLRATAPKKAEVHDQLEKYVRFMANDKRRNRVTEAYRDNCSLLVKLAGMAPSDKTIRLSPLIQMAALKNSDLTIEQKPRLVIFEGQTEKKGSPCQVKRVKTWSEHYRLLTSCQPQVFTGSEPYKLTK